MKITNKQLKQIIKEELSYILNEQEDRIQKLARYIRNGDTEDLIHGLELLEAAELEPWHRADLYQAIKSHVDPIKEKMKSLSLEIYELRSQSLGRMQTQWPDSYLLSQTEKLEKEQQEFEGTSAKPGMLMFEYTQQARPRWATTGTAIKPQTGDMFMFPALLQHWVAPYKSKVTRISVSGNLRVINWDKLPRDYF